MYYYVPYLNTFVVFDDKLEIAGGITADSIIHQIDDFEPFTQKPTKKKREKDEIHNEDIIYVHGMQLIMDQFDNPFLRAMIIAICTLITEDDSQKALKQKKYLEDAIKGFYTTPTYDISSEDGEEWRYQPYENIF